MKTLKNFLENCSNPELFQKVWKQGGLNFSEIKENPQDYYAANTGAVPGMIYYADTVAFAKKNVWLIQSALHEFENECGQLSKPTDDEQQYQNWLTWFAWENMMGEMLNYLEE